MGTSGGTGMGTGTGTNASAARMSSMTEPSLAQQDQHWGSGGGGYGSAYAGIIKSETPESLEINSPEEGLVTVKKVDIQSREKGLSGMPEGLGDLLSRQDLRNLIEYLASAK